MSEHTQDEFAETSPEQPGAGDLPVEEMTSQTAHTAEEPGSAETPAAEPGAETPAAEQTIEGGGTTPEKALPPEAQGEANGGPLGCCLGMMVGLLLSLTLAIFSRAYAGALGSLLQGNFWLLGLLVRILMGILAFALAIFFGYLGWKLGKRFYREYEPPPTRRRRAKPKKLHREA